MSSKAGKRPLRSLTAHEKLGAIRRVHDGESKASVARDIGVPESTLRGWCKNEDKISYLSRQSSPETDESAPGVESKEKKPKLDEVVSQPSPYNLCKKTTNGTSHSPSSDFAKNDFDGSKPLNLNVKMEREKERNRAELARLSIEFGLNRPEMFMPNVNGGNSLSELSASVGLLVHWNNMMMQQHKSQTSLNKIASPTDNANSNIGSFTAPVAASTPIKVETIGEHHKHHKSHHHHHHRTHKTEKFTDEAVLNWMKSQPSMVGLTQNQNGLPPAVSSCATIVPTVTSTSNNAYETQSNMVFWKWYKEFTDSYPFPQQMPDKPILYHQLTKDKDSHNTENIITEEKPAVKNNTKARAVLDNLFLNNNNNLGLSKRDVNDEALNQREALRHGEKFLEWLECCTEPSVTTMQILQFKYLLDNIKNGADRRNGQVRNKAKVKRK